MRSLSFGLSSAIAFVFLLSCTHEKLQHARTEMASEGALLLEDSDSDGTSTPDWKNSAVAGVYSNSDTPTIPQFIRLARTSVDIEIYEMSDPEVRSALYDVMAKDVRVRVIKEPKALGEKCDVFSDSAAPKKKAGKKKMSEKAAADCAEQRALVIAIRAKGGAFVPFAKKQLCGRVKAASRCFEHGKMILVDTDRMALISTGNFSATNLCDLGAKPSRCNRDYSYITRDTRITSSLHEIFEKDLLGKRYDLASIVGKPEVAARLTVSPYSREPLFAFLRSAKKSIQFQTQYLYANSELPDVLIAKAKEGVTVEVQLADVCSFGKPTETKAYENYLVFSAMESAGIKLRMFNKTHKINGKPGYLHAKAIVVDGTRAWVGSVNGSATSIDQNREFGLFFTHPVRVEMLSTLMRRDIEEPTAQTWRDSLNCRYVGYQSPQAATSDQQTPELKVLKATKSQGSSQRDGDEESEEEVEE